MKVKLANDRFCTYYFRLKVLDDLWLLSILELFLYLHRIHRMQVHGNNKNKDKSCHMIYYTSV